MQYVRLKKQKEAGLYHVCCAACMPAKMWLRVGMQADDKTKHGFVV